MVYIYILHIAYGSLVRGEVNKLNCLGLMEEGGEEIIRK
jgi:hypothetical protein